MIPMHRLILILFALLCGCDNSNDATRLKPIELRYGIYLARLDHRIMVSPDGTLRSVRTDNKSYGGNDVDPRHERVEVREGTLTAEQIADVARLFADWKSLSSTPYGSVADGGDVSIRYGDKTVCGGSGVPRQVTDARIRLMELVRSMPIVKQ